MSARVTEDAGYGQALGRLSEFLNHLTDECLKARKLFPGQHVLFEGLDDLLDLVAESLGPEEELLSPPRNFQVPSWLAGRIEQMAEALRGWGAEGKSAQLQADLRTLARCLNVDPSLSGAARGERSSAGRCST